MIFGAKKGRSVEDLAARLKVDPATLRASVETYNTAARAGGGDPLGKSPDMCQALETGPYYAAGRTAVGLPSSRYMSGLSLADCVFSGRRAGASAAVATRE